MSAPTPGPWRAGTEGKGRFCVYSDAPEAHGRGICRAANTQEDSAHPLNDIADANLRLIAAAPELLAALERCEEAIRCRDNVLGDPLRLLEVQDMARRAAASARAAIAKATGAQP